MNELVGWMQGLFADCGVRAPCGIGWDLDRADPPLIARVTPADRSTGQIRLDRDDVAERIDFATRLQAFLEVALGRAVPPCPNHGVALIPSRAGDAVEWRCPEGDFSARVGDYLDALWPPRSDEQPGEVAPMLAARSTRHKVSGVRRVGVERRGDGWVATLSLDVNSDEVAVRDAAAPLAVEIEAKRAEPVRTVHVQRAATDTEPAHRALTLRGGAMRLAALRGRLHRAGAGETGDFVVGHTQVRLGPEHRIGPPGGPVVFDASGNPFADDGDAVCCVGGFIPSGPVRGETRIFHAGELRVYD